MTICGRQEKEMEGKIETAEKEGQAGGRRVEKKCWWRAVEENNGERDLVVDLGNMIS